MRILLTKHRIGVLNPQSEIRNPWPGMPKSFFRIRLPAAGRRNPTSEIRNLLSAIPIPNSLPPFPLVSPASMPHAPCTLRSPLHALRFALPCSPAPHHSINPTIHPTPPLPTPYSLLLTPYCLSKRSGDPDEAKRISGLLTSYYSFKSEIRIPCLPARCRRAADRRNPIPSFSAQVLSYP